MSDQSDSQDKSEEQVNLSEGTSPSGSYDEGSRSTPSNLPKPATRQRRKRNSDSEDEDYVAAEEEVSSKKKVVKKEFGRAASPKPGLNKKAPAKRVPMSKARASTLETSKSTVGGAASEGKKKKERKRGRWCKKIDPMAEFERHSSDEEEEDAAPPKTAPKATAPDPKTAPKRSARNIPAAEKNKAIVPEIEEEDDEAQVLRKLKPNIPDHDGNHPVAENMKVRKDAGTRYQTTVAEWAKLINAPTELEDDIDVYAKRKKDHNSMANMYKEIPDKALETHKLGSVYYLLSGLATINTILRHTLLPKSGDHRMIRGHSINLLQLFDVTQKFKVMSLIVETIKRTSSDQKRSFVMDAEDPTSVEAQKKREKAKAEKAAKMPSAEEASQVFLKSKQDQLGYLIQATLRTEKGLATLNRNQESLERIIETKFYDLDLKMTEMQTTVEQLPEEAEERTMKATTDAF
nr:uncharacterized protein LOC109743430 [Aegilops tauschii subsp. strangulata]